VPASFRFAAATPWRVVSSSRAQSQQP